MALSKAWKKVRRDTWLLRIAALVISIMLWISVLGGKKVEINKTVVLDYQVPKSLVISNQVPKEIIVRVTGPRAILKEYEAREIVLSVELPSAVGEYDISVPEEKLDFPLGIKVLSISPSVIPIRLERLIPKRVPIRAVFSGQLPDGIKIVSVTLKPSTVEIRGAPSRLSAIDAIPTEAITPTANSLRQDFDVKLSVSDLPGVVVDEQSRFVHVVAELEGSLSRKWFKEIPIGLRVGSGRNAKQVDATGLGIRIRPQGVSFLIEGPDPMISKLKASDLDVWAEIPSLKAGSFKSRLDWRLAPELRVVKRSSDLVDVVVPPLK